MEFDNNGNLFPYKAHTTDLNEFEAVFGFDQRRKLLLSTLSTFIIGVQSIIPDDFTIWVDGSFVTQKHNPNDIDIVVFINFQHFESKENQLTALKERQEFVDLYYVKVFPNDHPNFDLTQFDKLDWFHFFTSDRKNKRKGFIELKF